MIWLLVIVLAFPGAAIGRKKPKTKSPLDDYVAQASSRNAAAAGSSAGSLWSDSAPLADLGRDLRAFRVDDLVTIVVQENASATASGSVDTTRSSNAAASVSALAGVTRAAGPLSSLAGLSSDRRLQGEGATARQTSLSTVLAARVTRVLPNGYLVVEGTKTVQVNSEQQIVRVRGVARPADLASGNVVRSDRLAQVEIVLNGKGVVGDAIGRPNFLYRLLMGLLPF
jgi:flagellar L-ring protein precursor FlgH